MGIKITGIKELERRLEREIERQAEEKLIAFLGRIGWETITAIRTGEASNWDDHSTNLRSSIGYLIVRNGEIVDSSGFTAVRKEGEEGARRGRAYAEELAGQYRKGVALIIVAGMEYAAYVEAIDGKQVLAGGELFAKKKVKELVAKYRR